MIAAVSFLALCGRTIALPRKSGQDGSSGKKVLRFDEFKQLAGEWTGHEMSGGKPGDAVTVNFKVTAAGSAVVETEFPSGSHEMMTVFTQDGDDVLLTHYCVMGNQPHMKAPNDGDLKTVAFEFAGASNMKSESSMHMHTATYTFIDKDTLRAEWTMHNENKPTGKVIILVHRKK